MGAMSEEDRKMVPKKYIQSAVVPIHVTCSCGGANFTIGWANSDGWIPVVGCMNCGEVSVFPGAPPMDFAMKALGVGVGGTGKPE